jgi:beta-galactosidase
MLWDWQSWWAQSLDWRPSVDHDARERADSFYEALYDRHLTLDFAHPEADLSGYPLVVVPALYLATEAVGQKLRAYVEGGGTLVVSYFSGIVDEHDTVHPGAYPGALRDVLGLTVEEWSPLLAGEQVRIEAVDGSELPADVWTEFVVPDGAEPVWTYADGPAAAGPAVTRHELGQGSAWYISTRLAPGALDTVLAAACADAGISPLDDLPRDVEVVRRSGEHGSYLFVINHTAAEAKVPIASAGTELLTGERAAGVLAVPPGAVRVVRAD